MINRRAFVVGGVAVLAAPRAAEAQKLDKIRQVGFLSGFRSSDAVQQRSVEAFRQGLRALGYVDGQNVALHVRWAEGKWEQLPALAAELVRLKVDVIVAAPTPAVKAAKDATTTIPIVMAYILDPVESGLVASIGRPGGNVTGLSMMAPEMIGKQMGLLRAIVPGLSRVALLWNPANPGGAPQLRQAEVAARALGVQLQPLEARGSKEIDDAFAAMARGGAEGLIVSADAMLLGQRARIVALAGRVPAVYVQWAYAEAGGLMAYSASRFDSYRRAALYVDKLLKGAKPADLPVEQPVKFDLIINLRTARALSITIPPPLILRADHIIE